MPIGLEVWAFRIAFSLELLQLQLESSVVLDLLPSDAKQGIAQWTKISASVTGPVVEH